MPIEIPLTRGLVAVIDGEDYDLVSSHRWRSIKSGKTYYAAAHIRKPDGNRTNLLMHRLILGLSDPKIQCDHIDGDGLNNIRANLRPCTEAENRRNSGKQSNNKSGLKGVCLLYDGKWQAGIGVNNKRIYLGRFATAEEAHEAYKKAAYELHGAFARMK